jgi:DNA-binding response OmpR family regulator
VAGTILFVDDEADLRFIATHYFEMAGHAVLGAADAAEALKISENVPLKVIILDANLPNEGSPPLLAALKKRNPQTPVIIFSGLPEDDDAIQSLLANGADKFVHKDGSLQTLVQTVQSLSVI